MSTAPQNESQTMPSPCPEESTPPPSPHCSAPRAHTLVASPSSSGTSAASLAIQASPRPSRAAAAASMMCMTHGHVAEQLDIPLLRRQSTSSLRRPKSSVPSSASISPAAPPFPAPSAQPSQVRPAPHHRPDRSAPTASPPGIMHVIILTKRDQRWILSRPADHTKDQTYFLFGLTQEQLSAPSSPRRDAEACRPAP